MTLGDEQTSTHRYQYLGIGPRWVRRSVLQTCHAAQHIQIEQIDTPTSVPTADATAMTPPTTCTHTTPVVTVNAPPTASLPLIDVSQYSWAELEQSVAACRLCHLADKRTQTVFGAGDQNARLMIVGEAPGAEEDRQGKPFVGQAGKLLDNMLASIQLSRQQGVFIANVLKCRPPQNRNPQKDEIACCSPYLARQIALLQPAVILAVGRYAIHTLLQTEAPISSLRGRLHTYADIPVIVTYHPAYLLRNLPDKFKAWQDLLLVKKTLVQSHQIPASA